MRTKAEVVKSCASGRSRPATSVEDGERSELQAALLCLSEVTARGLTGPAVDNQSQSQEQLDTSTAHKLRNSKHVLDRRMCPVHRSGRLSRGKWSSNVDTCSMRRLRRAPNTTTVSASGQSVERAWSQVCDYRASGKPSGTPPCVTGPCQNEP